MRDAATIASRMPRDGAHDGSRTADPEHLQSDAIPPADTRSRAPRRESRRQIAAQPCRAAGSMGVTVPRRLSRTTTRNAISSWASRWCAPPTPIPVSGRTLDGSGRSRFRLHRGDRLVLTGGDEPFTRDEWIYLLEGLGLVIWPHRYDAGASGGGPPISIPNRRRRARPRDYGIPIVDEDWLERALRNGLVEE